MENSTRHIYGMALQLALRTNLPLPIPEHSTLNELLAIEKDVAIPSNVYPTTKLAVIGRGGAQVVVGSDNTNLLASASHEPNDSGLFKMIPFAMREITADFDSATINKYRLRRIETHNGVRYAAYYAKLLDFSSSQVSLEYRVENNNVITTTPFAPTTADLNPTPTVLNTSGVNTTTKDYLASSVKFYLKLSVEDVAEIRNVCNIIYGDPRYAVITEIGICSGVDHTSMGDFNGTQLPYTESIGTQINNSVSCSYTLNSGAPQLEIGLSLSAIAPRLTAS